MTSSLDLSVATLNSESAKSRMSSFVQDLCRSLLCFPSILRISQQFVLMQQHSLFYPSACLATHRFILYILLSFYDFFFQKSVLLLSAHLFFLHPWGYESAVSVSDLLSCVEQFRHEHPNTLSLFLLFLLLSLFLCLPISSPSQSFSSSVFSSKGRLPPLHRPNLIFHFQITVTHSHFFFLPIFSFSWSLFFQYTERQTQQREAETQWACWHIRGGEAGKAEACGA